jgi:hypothetical protein
VAKKKEDDLSPEKETLIFDTDVNYYTDLDPAKKLHARVLDYLAAQYPHVFAATDISYLCGKLVWATVKTTVTNIATKNERVDIQEDIEDLINGIITIRKGG